MSKIESLQNEIKDLRESLSDYEKMLARANKRADLLRLAWRRVHPEDQAFMFAKTEEIEERGLVDVYNSLLYSFGRPGATGIVFTRLDSWLKSD